MSRFHKRLMGRPEDMKEIRFCWSIIRRYSISEIPIQGGLWHPDTPDNQRDLEVVMEAGNEQYGEGTHWIEECEA